MPRPSTSVMGRARAGYSLLELTLAVALVAGTLTPALALLRDGMTLSRGTDEQLLLTNYATKLLEERLAVVGGGWGVSTETGNLAEDGFPTLRYTVVSSDSPSDGGITDTLMHLEATTYFDGNGNNSLDADEASCSFRTKIAHFNSYVQAAEQ